MIKLTINGGSTDDVVDLGGFKKKKVGIPSIANFGGFYCFD